MKRRKIARVALGVLFITTSAPVVALAVDNVPAWILIAYLVAVVLIGRKCYRIIWVDDLGNFGFPEDETLTVEAIGQGSREISLVRTLIAEREFSEGRFSVGYRQSDVDAFFDRLSS